MLGDTPYIGERGVDYTETETYTENGETKTRSDTHGLVSGVRAGSWILMMS